ncbi:UDP-N-acetylglucosamine 2-epimerase (non-hydrolyzing) [Patulibacter brassicae]|jgi:UDP-N-acetylglucosamine 2-epimerase (non-hydrolysing)/UDP-GlcNAc3NAcA epimerase|uniref:UDP-N-acetylglucosamine 2-epimerase (Non-hydrolyzing) n=1 Tax=Patulibacter brassicae TaxID=1705717 RepID=A0ABU4VHV6_9ACTN|nr:UDP-N-acetylglucosamine 2-epimerase (non-hydrolyzing) [Patulibacter brassicae]MDX8151358.1 UDP-N-acetylglucosamine 2-epimerase (non-hydrolyzing) [Patulibacter brassicae]
MRIATVVGNRPQFVKAAAVSRPLRARHDERLIHTGQHHDDALSAVFFRELDLPAPDVELALGGGTNLAQTSRMIAELEPLLADPAQRPDVVLVYGDTNTTLAGALVAADLGIPIAHVEAGMRSFDRRMPEERNRVVTDHLAQLLLVPTPTATRNLEREGLADLAVDVGDVMTDVTLHVHPRARERAAGWLAERDLVPGGFLLATAHRAGNVDEPERLAALVDVLIAAAGPERPLVLPLHPRTAARLREHGEDARLRAAPGVRLVEPVGPLDFATLLVAADGVLTDSGGVQKEAYLAGVRCVTLRDTTEWTETVQVGWNRLVDLNPQAALDALAQPVPSGERPPLFGDGRAGERVVAALEQRFAG